MDRKSIEVAAAIIIDHGCILATQRGYGEWKDWWEFPGGKLEEGEEPRDALMREIKEEMNTEIEVGKHFGTVEYDYPKFHIKMHCFLCTLPHPKDLTLLEHEDAKWLNPDQLEDVKWLPADKDIIGRLKIMTF